MVAVGPVLFVFFNIVDLSSTWEKMTEVDFFSEETKSVWKEWLGSLSVNTLQDDSFSYSNHEQ